MKKTITGLLLIFSMLIPNLIQSVNAGELPDPNETFEEESYPGDMMEDPQEELSERVERARVLEIEEASGEDTGDGIYSETLLVRIEMLSGENRGEEIDAYQTLTGNPTYDFSLREGDRVLVSEIEIGGVSEIHVVEYERDMSLYIVLGVFLTLLILLGGKKGIKTIFTLALTLLLLFQVLIPGLLAGYSPILLSVGVSIVVTVVTIMLVGGRNIKSYAAIIGVLGGVLIAGVIAYVVGSRINLTGLSSQEAMMLMYIPQEVNFDFSGLLFAGIILGALGAVMDVGMSIASAMEEIRLVDPSIPTKKLVLSGMNVGKDIMGTMANTLILAYIGSMIPVLLLFTAYQEPFIGIINMDIIATEVIRALAGSIGLILSIPLTAVSVGLLRNKCAPQKSSHFSEDISE